MSDYTRRFDYDPATEELVLTVSARDRGRAASVPGLKFHKPTETWRSSCLLSVALAVRGVFGNDIEVTDAAYAAVEPEFARWERVRAVKNGEQDAGAALPRLRPAQNTAVYLAADERRFLIGDEKGYGKTIEAIMALEVMESREPGSAYPALVVATKSMQYAWQAEFQEWTGRTVAVCGRTPARRREALASGADVIVVSWNQLALHSSLAGYGSTVRTEAEKEPKELNHIPFRSVVADEAHRSKNPKAKMTRALWSVAHGPTVRNRLALSATPVAGHTVDLWGVLHFLRPDMFPSRSKFIDRYVLTHQNHFGGFEDLGLNPQNEAEFRMIFDAMHIRRPLDLDVGLLPIQYRFVEMDGKQRTVYNKMAKDSLVSVDGRHLVAVGPLVVNTRLHQLAQATPVLDDDGNVCEFTLPSCKYDLLCDVLDEMGDEPLVVFSGSRLLIEMCERELTKSRFRPDQVGTIIGSQTALDRARTVEDFQAGKLRVILCTIAAGSEGITLTRAHTMLFLSRSYSFVGNNQAEGRLLRHGQTRDVQIIEAITLGSEEMRVHESFARKADRAQEVVQDDEYERREVDLPRGAEGLHAASSGVAADSPWGAVAQYLPRVRPGVE